MSAPAGFEDPQAQQAQEADEGEVARVHRLAGDDQHGLGKPLHRTWDDKLIGRNRSAAKKVCDDVWTESNGDISNCDGYPMASTEEGSALGDGNFSALLIGAKAQSERR